MSKKTSPAKKPLKKGLRKNAAKSAEKASKKSAVRPTQAAPDARTTEAEIPETLVLTTVEQFKSISMPLRLRILQAVAETPMTTKQVALQLGEPITKLYRHVDALWAAGLLKLVAETPKRGTIQKFFRAAARRFAADNTCLPGWKSGNASVDVIFNLLDQTRRSVSKLAADPAPTQSAHAAASVISLPTPESAAELVEALARTLQDFSDSHGPKLNHQSESYRVAIFVHPDVADS